jgi:hypothetical protein
MKNPTHSQNNNRDGNISLRQEKKDFRTGIKWIIPGWLFASAYKESS